MTFISYDGTVQKIDFIGEYPDLDELKYFIRGDSIGVYSGIYEEKEVLIVYNKKAEEQGLKPNFKAMEMNNQIILGNVLVFHANYFYKSSLFTKGDILRVNF
jgi:hypothetical protein